MLFIIAMIMGMILGIAAGGKISNLSSIKIEKAWLIIAAFIIMTGMQILGNKITLSYGWIMLSEVIMLCLLLAGFWLNRRYWGIWAVGGGYLLNALVMGANGGRMPVSMDLISKLDLSAAAVNNLIAGKDIKHAIIDSNTKFAFLADIFHPPSFLSYMMQVVSIGDFIVIFGLFLIIFQAVLRKTVDNKKSTGGLISEKIY